MDTYLQVFNALEQAVELRSQRATDAASMVEIERDGVWYAIKALAAALDGADPQVVRAVLLNLGYRL